MKIKRSGVVRIVTVHDLDQCLILHIPYEPAVFSKNGMLHAIDLGHESSQYEISLSTALLLFQSVGACPSSNLKTVAVYTSCATFFSPSVCSVISVVFNLPQRSQTPGLQDSEVIKQRNCSMWVTMDFEATLSSDGIAVSKEVY